MIDKEMLLHIYTSLSVAQIVNRLTLTHFLTEGMPYATG